MPLVKKCKGTILRHSFPWRLIILSIVLRYCFMVYWKYFAFEAALTVCNKFVFTLRNYYYDDDKFVFLILSTFENNYAYSFWLILGQLENALIYWNVWIWFFNKISVNGIFISFFTNQLVTFRIIIDGKIHFLQLPFLNIYQTFREPENVKKLSVLTLILILAAGPRVLLVQKRTWPTICEMQFSQQSTCIQRSL